jgi:hypothetical protein
MALSSCTCASSGAPATLSGRVAPKTMASEASEPQRAPQPGGAGAATSRCQPTVLPTTSANTAAVAPASATHSPRRGPATVVATPTPTERSSADGARSTVAVPVAGRMAPAGSGVIAGVVAANTAEAGVVADGSIVATPRCCRLARLGMRVRPATLLSPDSSRSCRPIDADGAGAAPTGVTAASCASSASASSPADE